MATSSCDVFAAHALRYQVFVDEMGADGPDVDHKNRIEKDPFDQYAEQLILLDTARPRDTQVVGVYRLMDDRAAAAAGQFYSENEYDLTPLRESGRPLLELGRSCVHPEYRGGTAMLHLWQALARVVQSKGVEILFGVASFPGQDPNAHAQSLSLLARDHLAPPELRARATAPQNMQLCDDIERVSAVKNIPALIKAYLRLGGFVGEGAFVDKAFNTTDVCLILDTQRMNDRQRSIYAGSAKGVKL